MINLWYKKEGYGGCVYRQGPLNCSACPRESRYDEEPMILDADLNGRKGETGGHVRFVCLKCCQKDTAWQFGRALQSILVYPVRVIPDDAVAFPLKGIALQNARGIPDVWGADDPYAGPGEIIDNAKRSREPDAQRLPHDFDPELKRISLAQGEAKLNRVLHSAQDVVMFLEDLRNAKPALTANAQELIDHKSSDQKNNVGAK